MAEEVKMVKVKIDDLEDMQDLGSAYAKYVSGFKNMVKNPDYVENSTELKTKYKYLHKTYYRYENLISENYIISASTMYLSIKGHRLDLVSDCASPATWHVSGMFPEKDGYVILRTSSQDPVKAVMKALIKKAVNYQEEVELPE